MRALGPGELLSLWETEDQMSPAECALTLLDTVVDEEERRVLGTLTVGARDAWLLELRLKTLGDNLQAQTRCPSCGERLEFALSVTGLLASLPAVTFDAGWHIFEDNGWHIRFRVPRAVDLFELGRIAPATDLIEGLLENCVDRAEHEGSLATIEQIPEEIVSALASRMGELDPCADILLALSCSACQNAWQSPFDILGYFRAELRTHTKRLLCEVNILARNYGWREADILAMSSRRRRAYLGLVGV